MRAHALPGTSHASPGWDVPFCLPSVIIYSPSPLSFDAQMPASARAHRHLYSSLSVQVCRYEYSVGEAHAMARARATRRRYRRGDARGAVREVKAGAENSGTRH